MKYKIRLFSIIVLLALPTLWFCWNYERDSPSQYALYGDAMGYYLYLPATLIYHNLDHIARYPDSAQLYPNMKRVLAVMDAEGTRAPNGRIVNQYTYGIALMEAPFFLAAHVIEKVRGKPATGFSAFSVAMSLRVSSLVYALLGLLLLYRVLLRHFSQTVSLLTAGLLWLGTNLFYFAIPHTGMAHVPLFFLYAALLLATVRLYERPGTGRFLLLAFLAGLITLIRPTDVLCLLIPFGYGVYNRATLRARFSFVKKYWRQLLLSAFVFVLPALPQFAYWKFVTGHYLFYSYGEQGFDWLHPQVTKGLFYPTNGWLYYTPLMGLALLGLLLYRSFRPWLLPLLLILPIYIYIIYSWWCYNYINGLGSRPMIHLYPLLALPLAATVNYFNKKRNWLTVIYWTLALLTVGVNLRFTVLATLGWINPSESTHAYNRCLFFKSKMDYEALLCRDLQLKAPPEDIRRIGVLDCLDFNNQLPAEKYIPDSVHGGMMLYTGTHEYPAPVIRMKYDRQKFGGAKWLRGSGLFYAVDTPAYYRHLMALNIKHSDSSLAWYGVEVENKIGIADSSCAHAGGEGLDMYHLELNRWGEVWFFVPLPEEIQNGDEIEFLLWNIGQRPIYMKNLCLELWH